MSVSSKRSKEFVIHQIRECGGHVEPLEEMSFSQLLTLRKDLALKKLEESGTEITEDVKSLSKAEIQEKIDKNTVTITQSLIGLFSDF